MVIGVPGYTMYCCKQCADTPGQHGHKCWHQHMYDSEAFKQTCCIPSSEEIEKSSTPHEDGGDRMTCRVKLMFQNKLILEYIQYRFAKPGGKPFTFGRHAETSTITGIWTAENLPKALMIQVEGNGPYAELDVLDLLDMLNKICGPIRDDRRLEGKGGIRSGKGKSSEDKSNDKSKVTKSLEWSLGKSKLEGKGKGKKHSKGKANEKKEKQGCVILESNPKVQEYRERAKALKLERDACIVEHNKAQ